MTITVETITRYPVKGLSPQEMESVSLTPGEGLPDDRRFALALASTLFDPQKPEWLSKSHFLMLAKYPRLAALSTHYDGETGVLSIERNGKRVAAGNPDQPVGRAVIADFFSAYMRDEIQGTPKLVAAAGHMFSDHRNKVVSIINRASLGDLERVVKSPLAPHRFRANLLIAGGRAWEEFDWVEKEITIGPARLLVTARIDRCTATNVDPRTGEADMNIPRALRRGFDHIDFGVYARVLSGGEIIPGAELKPPA